MRNAKAQKLFATGAGTKNVDGIGPATMAVESVTPMDVQQARALP
jgi:hypothetical protein